MDTSEDKDMKRAMALSVQEQDPQPSADNEVIDLGPEGGLPNASVTVPSSVPASTSHTLLGLDRKAMEQERLARKRKASISPPPSRKAMKSSASSIPQILEVHPTQDINAMYLDGIVKKTWVFTFARQDDITIEEVLQREHLELAVLSSFQWDMEWLLEKLNFTKRTQLYFIMQAKDDATKREYTNDTKNMKNLHLCFPSMAGQVNCMHSKLMLLRYPSHLRVVVSTANLEPGDWGGTQAIENTVFLIDLPRKSDGHHNDTTELTAFGKELVYFLQAMGLDDAVVQSVHKFDFSRTKDMAFVHTIGGVHVEDEAWGRTGYCGLGRAVKQMGLDTHKSLDMDYVTSSIGSLNIDFLTRLYLAAQGDDGLTEYTWRCSKKTKKTSDADKEAQEFKDRVETDVSKDFHIYFPTRDTVVGSKGGIFGGGRMCFEEKWYESPTFPQQLLRDYQSHRGGVVMHNKFILVRQKEEAPQDLPSNSRSSAWVYIGSANCSESAWGKLTKDRVSKAPKLNCRNWECGVVIPMRSLQRGSHDGSNANIVQPLQSTGQQRSLRDFEDLFPVPMQYPGEEYGTRRPWFYQELPENRRTLQQ